MTELKEPLVVTLLIAIRNEAKFVERTLETVLNQDYPPECLEVYILDGMSTDNSWQIVERLIAGRPNFHLVQNPGITQSAGWNLGIKLAKGDVVGIIGGHTELAADYVTMAVETLLRTGADMVGGPMRADSETFLGKAISLATSTPFGVGGARFHYTEQEEELDTVYMGLCWRGVYERIGGFDEEMVRNQDDELSYRLLSAGGRIVCNPAIRSRYFNRATLRSLLRQYYQYGYWKVRVLQKHMRQMRSRHFVPPAFVGSLILFGLTGLFSEYGRLAFLSLLGLYVTANLLVSLWVSLRYRLNYFPLLVLVFGSLHFSYGSGFLVGLFAFAKRWNDKRGKVPEFHSIVV